VVPVVYALAYAEPEQSDQGEKNELA